MLACFRSHLLYPQCVPHTTDAAGPTAKYRSRVLKDMSDKGVVRNHSNNSCLFDYVLLAQTEPGLVCSNPLNLRSQRACILR